MATGNTRPQQGRVDRGRNWRWASRPAPAMCSEMAFSEPGEPGWVLYLLLFFGSWTGGEQSLLPQAHKGACEEHNEIWTEQ